MIFLSKWVFFWFQPLIFQGVFLAVFFFAIFDNVTHVAQGYVSNDGRHVFLYGAVDRH